MNRVPKPKKCKVCGKQFQPHGMGQVVCSPGCAIRLLRDSPQEMAKVIDGAIRRQRAEERRAAKALRAQLRERKEKLMTRRDWIKKAQAAFNRYIRLRDQHQPCICCGRPLGDQRSGGSYDAGHYRSVGSAPHLRFHEDNCHAQLKVCNRFGAGRAVDYRLGLIQRIGLARVEALEADQAPRKYTIDELKEIVTRYRAKAREIERGRG